VIFVFNVHLLGGEKNGFYRDSMRNRYGNHGSYIFGMVAQGIVYGQRELSFCSVAIKKPA
jgi:hypothetical protein